MQAQHAGPLSSAHAKYPDLTPRVEHRRQELAVRSKSPLVASVLLPVSGSLLSVNVSRHESFRGDSDCCVLCELGACRLRACAPARPGDWPFARRRHRVACVFFAFRPSWRRCRARTRTARTSIGATVPAAPAVVHAPVLRVFRWIVQKFPRVSTHAHPHIKTGHGYAYADARTPALRMSSHSLNDATKGAVGLTMAPLYGDTSGLGYAQYNDHTPEDKQQSTRGHIKGVTMFDAQGGFWIIHSVPRYSPYPADGYSYVPSGVRYGQSYICVSLDRANMAKVGTQLRHMQPLLYTNVIPANLRTVRTGSPPPDACARLRRRHAMAGVSRHGQGVGAGFHQGRLHLPAGLCDAWVRRAALGWAGLRRLTVTAAACALQRPEAEALCYDAQVGASAV